MMSEMDRPASGSRSDETASMDTGEIHRETSTAYDRTWELELLIAGAVVFALIQLPSVMDELFWRAQVQSNGPTYRAIFVVYYYSKLSCYVLITTFIVHL